MSNIDDIKIPHSGDDTVPNDIMPVVHGYWDDSFDGITPVCSVCGMTHRKFIRCPESCPHCGAVMDGKEGAE